jgi:hypothetical protein
MRRLLAVLLLLSAPVAAQEEIVPNTHLADSGNLFDNCDTNAHLEIDDTGCGDSAGDSNLCCAGASTTCGQGESAASWSLRVGFGTPSDDPTTGTDDQEFRGAAFRTSGGNNPTVALDAFCNASLHEAGVDNDITKTTVCTNPTPLGTLSELWTFGGSCATDGSDVEVRIDAIKASGGGPSTRQQPRVCCVNWEATVGGARRRMFQYSELLHLPGEDPAADEPINEIVTSRGVSSRIATRATTLLARREGWERDVWLWIGRHDDEIAETSPLWSRTEVAR